jgi:hypothetical protein
MQKIESGSDGGAPGQVKLLEIPIERRKQMNRDSEWSNGKISRRQLGRLLFHDYFPVVGLVLPMYLAELGAGGLPALILGLSGGYGLLLLFSGQIKYMGQGYPAYLKKRFGRWLAAAIRAVSVLAALLGAAYGLALLGELAGRYLSVDTPVWLLLAVAALLAVYGLLLGIESRGRKYGILFWLLVLPLAGLFFLALGSLKPGRLLSGEWDGNILGGAWQVYCCMLPAAFLPVYAPAANSSEDLVRAGKRGFCVAAIGNVILYILLAGVFGTSTLAVMEHGALTLTALVKIPGGFLERQDALLCGIWILSVYSFAENAMGVMYYCLGGLDSKGRRRTAGVWSVLAAFALGLCMYRSPEIRDAMFWLYRRLFVPVLTAVGVVGFLLVKWDARGKEGEM